MISVVDAPRQRSDSSPTHESTITFCARAPLASEPQRSRGERASFTIGAAFERWAERGDSRYIARPQRAASPTEVRWTCHGPTQAGVERGVSPEAQEDLMRVPD